MKTQPRLYSAATLVMFCALLSGCAPDTTSLMVKSEPDGAYITQSDTGAALGVAPVSLEYEKAKLLTKANKDHKAGCFRVKGFNARWISGATASSNPYIRLCNPVGKSFTVTVKRNTSDPGLEQDQQFAKQDRDLQVKQQEAAAKKQPAKTAQPTDAPPPE
jgi:hypothetical protein